MVNGFKVNLSPLSQQNRASATTTPCQHSLFTESYIQNLCISLKIQ